MMQCERTTMPRAETTDLPLDVLAETDRAWLVSDGGTPVWLPKSLVERQGDGDFTVPVWLAEREGLV
jgi:hypothetical protein